MKDLPVEKVWLYRVVDLSTGIPHTETHVAFINFPQGAWDWREIGTLAPGATGTYQYEQSAHFPKPPIDACILRAIADRIDMLNSRAQEKESSQKSAQAPR